MARQGASKDDTLAICSKKKRDGHDISSSSSWLMAVVLMEDEEGRKERARSRPFIGRSANFRVALAWLPEFFSIEWKNRVNCALWGVLTLLSIGE